MSGIQEYARRVRESRVQFGWAIASGVTIKEILEDEAEEVPDELKDMTPSEYVLLNTEQDREAALRWNAANTIRKQRGSVREKILKFLRENVGRGVTSEELRYVAGDKTEWARRVRELRTEFGWQWRPIDRATDLGIGVISAGRSAKAPNTIGHSRRCGERCCGAMGIGAVHVVGRIRWNPSDPRHLELHHVGTTPEAVKHQESTTLCTVCHDSCIENEVVRPTMHVT